MLGGAGRGSFSLCLPAVPGDSSTPPSSLYHGTALTEDSSIPPPPPPPLLPGTRSIPRRLLPFYQGTTFPEKSCHVPCSSLVSSTEIMPDTEVCRRGGEGRGRRGQAGGW